MPLTIILSISWSLFEKFYDNYVVRDTNNEMRKREIDSFIKCLFSVQIFLGFVLCYSVENLWKTCIQTKIKEW